MRKAMVLVLALAAFSAMALLPLAQSQPATPQSSFCQGLLVQPFGQGASGLRDMIPIAYYIMLVMASITGLVYAIGYALNIGNLVRFAKSEIGEIILTAVIIAVFAGFIYGMNGIASISFGSSTTVFQADCGYVAQASVNVLDAMYTYFYPLNMKLEAIEGVGIQAAPNDFGVTFSPFTGFGYVKDTTTKLMDFTGAIAIMLVGIAVFLGILYSVFPMFLFLGIVLRTLPVTRPAGGGFLGFFVGFYILFPAMMFFMLALPAQSSTLQGGGVVSSLQATTNFFTSASSFYSAVFGSLTITDILSNFVTHVVDTVFYTLLVVVISIIVSFDMSELLAGVIGAPSLSSRQMLRRII